jgi:hypothetical protein
MSVMATPERAGFDAIVEFDPEMQSYIIDRTETGISPSHSVIEGVSEVTAAAPDEMQPLYEVVDSDALDRLFTRKDAHGTALSDGFVRFRYEGTEVTVYADGRTAVSRLDCDGS